MLKSIGADEVVDYTKEQFPTGKKYDVIFDMVYNSSFSKCISALAENGYYLMANSSPRKMLRGLWVERTIRKKVRFALADEKEEDLNFLVELISAKKIKPVIDRIYPLEQTIEAHRYVEQSLKKGSVVIRVRS